METIESNWRFTWNPGVSGVVLVEYGNELAAEPEPQVTPGLEVVQIIDGVPFLRATGSDIYQFTLRVFQDAASDAAARRGVMQSLMAVPSWGVKPLRVQAKGDTAYWQFASAFVTGHSPARSMVDPTGQARFVKTYNITGVSLTQAGA